MKPMCRILLCLALFTGGLTLRSVSQTPMLPDSTLRETLTRAVQYWQAGKAKEAFFALDTINSELITADNTSTKIKAAIWTANYLQAQKKIKPAAHFLDSAMVWAEKYSPGADLGRVYEAYADWHLTAGNPKTALVAREAAWKIRDSLNQASLKTTIDSLQGVAQKLEEENSQLLSEKSAEADHVSTTADSMKKWAYLLGIVCAILIVIIFLMNGTLQRLRNAPPAPAPSAPRTRPEPVPIETTVTTSAKKESTANAIKTAPLPTPPTEPAKPATTSILSPKDITLKLQDVELVLIRAEVLGKYQNGETKAIRNLLNEYMAQLPFIMKTLDDAITKNEPDPILLSLEHLKTYLQSFGMVSTLKLIQEIEEEAQTEKVSKLLSRVFQVRNHCRRAADESKALLEKIG